MPVKTLKDHANASGGVRGLRGNPTEVTWEPVATLPGVSVPIMPVVTTLISPFASRLVDEPGRLEPRFLCACGRLVDLDMMIDLDNDDVPPGLRVANAVRSVASNKNFPSLATRRFACDGCWTDWVRRGLIDKNDLRRAIGAPVLPPQSQKPW